MKIRAQHGGAVETGTITKISGIGGTLADTVCYKKNNVVVVGGRIHTMPDTTAAAGTFFQIPEGFRPIMPTTGSGRMMINDVMSPMAAMIGTDGRVNLIWSSGSKTTQVGFEATYPV